MAYNVVKLAIVGVLALALIVALTVGNLAAEVGVPILTLLVGYVIGNASVLNIPPIINKEN